MDQLSQRSSSERTQFMSREDLDQEGSLDLDHDQYQYQDKDQDQYADLEDEHEEHSQKQTFGGRITTPTKALEVKVERKEMSKTMSSMLWMMFISKEHNNILAERKVF